MQHEKKLKDSKNLSILAITLFILTYFPPLFKNTIEHCEAFSLNQSSSIDIYLAKLSIFFKIFLFLFLLKNINEVFNFVKEKILIFFIFYLFLLASISSDISYSVIIIFNWILFLLLIYYFSKIYKLLFLKIIFIYLLLVVFLSSLDLFFDAFKNFSSYCYAWEGSPQLQKTGFANDKNLLGLYVFVINFIYIFNLSKHNSLRLIKLLLFIISFLFLIYINSIAALFALILIYSLLIMPSNQKFFFINLSIIFFVILSIFLNLEFILSLFNRDLTLTGRVNIWSEIFALSDINLLFGQGPGIMAARLLDYQTYVDSTYIYMLNDLGMIFTIMYFIWILKHIKNIYIIKSNIICLVAIFYAFIDTSVVIFSISLINLLFLINHFNENQQD